ncbi:hypothetical protein Zm00014a_012869 [Zea mays]|uniref:Uncharacterized protein n=1 Tax=Zea mays TaxID=4577 RepID=A0A3L6EHG7_MAIZE|nr:hypothetical protein Zm00014a_012869 [Zea mays]
MHIFLSFRRFLMEPAVLNRERVALDKKNRMPVLFDDYSDDDFYGVQRKYSIVARIEVKFPIEPRYRDRQHYILSDINGAKIEAIANRYEIVKYFNSLLHEKHVYKMHNVWFGLNPGAFNFRHLNGTMELYFTHQTIVEPYAVPVQMPPFPKHIFLNLDDIAELPNRTLVENKSVSNQLTIQQYTSNRSITTPIILNIRWDIMPVANHSQTSLAISLEVIKMNCSDQWSMLRSVRGKGIGKDMQRCPLNKKREE